MDEIRNQPNPPPLPSPPAGQTVVVKESKTPTFLLGVAVGCGSSFLLFVGFMVISLVAISTLGGNANKTFSNVASAVGT